MAEERAKVEVLPNLPHPDFVWRDQYQILEKIATTRDASLYLAEDKRLSRVVVLKFLAPHLFASSLHKIVFVQEARALARLDSPHIVKVYEFGKDKHPFMAMEYVPGVSLQQLLDHLQSAPIPPEVAAALICQAAEALIALEEQGMVHRDLAPANVLLSDKGLVKLVDFGRAHLRGSNRTSLGEILGTVGWMSPEQALGQHPLTIQSDLFVLGSLFYYCLTGRPPFGEGEDRDIQARLVAVQYPALETQRPPVDPALRLCLTTLLQKSPGQRKNPMWLRHQLGAYLARQDGLPPIERVRRYLQRLETVGLSLTRFHLPEHLTRPPRKGNRLLRGLRHRKGMGLVLGAGALVAMILWGTRAQSPPLPMPHPPSDKAPLISAPGSTERASSTAGPRPQANSQKLLPPLQPLQQGSASPPESARLQEASPRLPPVPLEPEGVALTLESSPPFAEVYVEGEFLGVTPLIHLSLPAGEHRFSFYHKGRQTDTVLSLSPGKQILRMVLP